MIRRIFVWSVVVAFWVSPASLAGQSVPPATGMPVILEWDPNALPPSGYAVFVGTQSDVYVEAYDAGLHTRFTYSRGVVGQQYFFAVAAYTAGPTLSGYSNEVSAIIQSPPTVFLQPADVSGSTVSLRWGAPSSMQVVEYLLQAGTASGLGNLFSGSVGNVTSVSSSVSAGTYYVRVYARSADGSTVGSNEISFSVGPTECTGPPPTPTGVTGAIEFGAARLQWTPVTGATSYALQAGSAPGLSDVFQGVVGSNSTVIAAVPAGFTAYVRVIALNACGLSAPSAEILLR